jgi:hypothetical protein
VPAFGCTERLQQALAKSVGETTTKANKLDTLLPHSPDDSAANRMRAFDRIGDRDQIADALAPVLPHPAAHDPAVVGHGRLVSRQSQTQTVRGNGAGASGSPSPRGPTLQIGRLLVITRASGACGIGSNRRDAPRPVATQPRSHLPASLTSQQPNSGRATIRFWGSIFV